MALALLLSNGVSRPMPFLTIRLPSSDLRTSREGWAYVFPATLIPEAWDRVFRATLSHESGRKSDVDVRGGLAVDDLDDAVLTIISEQVRAKAAAYTNVAFSYNVIH